MCTHVTRRLGLLGSCATALFLWSPAVQGADSSVDWIDRVNVTISGDTLQKTGGCNGCEDAGASSRQAIWRGDGYVEFSPGEMNTFWLAGLGHNNDGTAFRDIEFAFRFNGAGQADVMENGVYQNGSDTTYRVGDVFRIAIVNGRVQYSKNGTVLYESHRAPEYPLMLDTSLGNVGATIRNARISNDYFDGEGSATLSRFERLDANRDGRIQRSEWRGSWGAFEAQDLDGNNVLTWDEFSSDGYDTRSSTRSIDVNPGQRWTDTGLWVSEGDMVMFTAAGTMQLSTNANDVASPNGARTNRRAADAPLPGYAAGALIAQIGNAPPMFIGNERSLVASTAGRLALGINDDYLGDNRGNFRVDITVRPRY